MKNFIRTTDEQTADELRKAGFKELPKQGNAFCFLNNKKVTFSAEVEKNLKYTNAMTV